MKKTKCIQCQEEKTVFQKHMCADCLKCLFSNMDFTKIIDSVRQVPQKLLRDLGVR